MESEVLKELRLIRSDLKYIRAHMVDQDMILSTEEKTLLEESRQDLREGKTRSLDDVMRARNGTCDQHRSKSGSFFAGNG